MKGYNRQNEFIATQGPLPDTIGDFWRMVWDYEVPTIVMLTNLQEKIESKQVVMWPVTWFAVLFLYRLSVLNIGLIRLDKLNILDILQWRL